MRRYWQGAAIGAAIVGIPLGLLTADNSEAPQPALPVGELTTLPVEPEADSVIRVVGIPSGSSSSTWKATAVGGLIGGGGAVLAQVAASRFNRRHRRDDRKLERIDAMLEALDELEIAYAEDITNDDPDIDASNKLAAAERKFARSVQLVSGHEVREAAEQVQSTLRQHALTFGETDEDDRPTLKQIKTLQDALMKQVKDAVRKLR